MTLQVNQLFMHDLTNKLTLAFQKMKILRTELFQEPMEVIYQVQIYIV